MKRVIDVSETLYKTCKRLVSKGDPRPSESCIANSEPYEPQGDLTEAEKKICKMYLEDLDKFHTCNEYKLLMNLIDNAKTVEPRDNFDLGYIKGLEDGKREAEKWVKITYRPMTKEEEIAYKREFGIDYGDTLSEYENKVFTCELPNDKQDILIQTNWGVKQDTCDWSDGYCGLEENCDWDGVIAWRPTPEYKESEGAE